MIGLLGMHSTDDKFVVCSFVCAAHRNELEGRVIAEILAFDRET